MLAKFPIAKFLDLLEEESTILPGNVSNELSKTIKALVAQVNQRYLPDSVWVWRMDEIMRDSTAKSNSRVANYSTRTRTRKINVPRKADEDTQLIPI